MVNNKKTSNHLLTKILRLSPPQILALSFFITILVGASLLKLPLATTTFISWGDALFTATSAITVTGLIVVDTGTAFTIFGQVVIMVLIQLGGLGLMTYAVLILLILGKRVGLHERILIKEAFNQHSLGGLVQLVKKVFIFSISIEAFAFMVLSVWWGMEYG